MALRVLRELVFVALLGLASTVAIAWIFFLNERPGFSMTAPASLKAVLCGGAGTKGCDEYWLSGSAVNPGVQKALFPSPWPRGARGVSIRISGWPFRSLRCGRYLRNDGSGFDDWGMIRFGGPGWNGIPFDRSVPVLPIWTGFAADVAIYTAAWWIIIGGLWRLSGPARRKRRRRRGLCISCGYDLCGDLEAGCPECGWNRAPSGALPTTATQASRTTPAPLPAPPPPPLDA